MDVCYTMDGLEGCVPRGKRIRVDAEVDLASSSSSSSSLRQNQIVSGSGRVSTTSTIMSAGGQQYSPAPIPGFVPVPVCDGVFHSVLTKTSEKTPTSKQTLRYRILLHDLCINAARYDRVTFLHGPIEFADEAGLWDGSAVGDICTFEKFDFRTQSFISAESVAFLPQATHIFHQIRSFFPF